MGYLAHIVAMEVFARVRFGRAFLRRAFQLLRQPDPSQRHGCPRKKYLPKLISGEHVGARHVRAERRLRCRARCACAPTRRAIATFSTAPRCGSPTAATPIRWSSTPRPISTPAPRGMTAFIIERRLQGFSHGQHLDKARHARLQHLSAVLRQLRSARKNVMGKVGDGRVLMSGLDYERAVPIGRAARHHGRLHGRSRPYMHERKQFGRTDRRLPVDGRASSPTCIRPGRRRAPTSCGRPRLRRQITRARCARTRRRHSLFCGRRRGPARRSRRSGRRRLYQRFPVGRFWRDAKALRDRRGHRKSGAC